MTNSTTRSISTNGSEKGAGALMKLMAIAVVLGVAAIGCSSTPEPIGYSQQANRCDPKMQSALDVWAEQGYSGAIAILGDDRDCAIGIGTADYETGRPVTVETTFSIGSVTKAVTAAAVLDLVDKGAVGLDDTAGQHVAGLAGAVNDLTIRNLLRHTSGLTGHHGQDHVALSKAEAVDAISQLEISFAQGTDFSYTNAGYTLLALVVEAASEQGYRQYLIDEILLDGAGEPIGGFWDGDPAAPAPRAIGYLAGGEPGEAGDFAGPHWALDGNGGVAMTTLEMAEWTRALFSGEILSEDATESLTSIRKRHPGGGSELPGWVELPPQVIGERLILASGGGGSIGHLMDVAWLPDTGRVIAVAQNATSRNVNDLLFNIADALVTGTGVPVPATILEADPIVVEQMVGTYRPAESADQNTATDASTDVGTDIIEVKVDDLDPRGLLVSASGPSAIAALFPPAAGFEGEIERHEAAALALANGETAEGAGLRAQFESEFGPIVEVRILATVSIGALVTYLELETESSGEVPHLLALELNDQGGSEAIGLDPALPDGWFLYQPDGSFVMHGLSPDDPVVRLRPVDGGLELAGPNGTVTAVRVG